MMAMQAASLDKEDGSLGPQSQATGGVARAQDLAADLSRPSFEDAPSAAPAQVCFALPYAVTCCC